jgi:outer membrane protein TolC
MNGLGFVRTGSSPAVGGARCERYQGALRLFNGLLCRFNVRACALMVSLGFVTGVQAQSGSLPTLEATEPAALSDSDVLRLDPPVLLQRVVERNAQVLLARLQSQVAERTVEAERALYDPVLFAGARREFRNQQRNLEDVQKNLQDLLNGGGGGLALTLDQQINNAEGGVRTRAPSGAELSVAVRNQRRQSNLLERYTDQAELRASVVVTLKQPLLRGFGRDIVETDLRVAELESRAAAADYVQNLERVSAEALTAYWQLQRANAVAEVLRRSRDTAASLLRDVESRVEAGRSAPLGVLEARSVLMLREAELSRAAQTRQDAEARIKALLRVGSEANRATPLRIEADTDPSSFAHEPDMSAAAIGRAIDRWPAVRIAALRRDQALLRLKFAENQRRPNLELQASYGTSGQGFDSSRIKEEALTTRYPEWTVGLNYEMPLNGSRKATGQYEAQWLRVRQASEELLAVRSGLAVDLQSRLQQLRPARDEIAKLREEVDTRRRLVELETMQVRMGVTRLGQLLTREQEFVESSVRLVEGQTRYALLLTGVMLANGSLLSAHGIEVRE